MPLTRYKRPRVCGTRAEYAAQVREIAATLADDPSAAAQERALAVLALLSGGMIMAHAVGDSPQGSDLTSM